MEKVRSRSGTPVESDFRSASGTPFVVDEVSGAAYLYANGEIVPINEISAKGSGATMDGTTDDYTALSGAASVLSALGGGILKIEPGTLAFGTAFVVPDNVVVRGSGIGATTLKWIGGNSASAITFPNATNNAGLEDLTVDCVAATGMTGVHFVDTRDNHLTRVSITTTVTASGVGLRLQAGSGGDGSDYNCVWNTFHQVRVTKFNIGIQFDGDSTTPTVATNNKFYDTRISYPLLAIRFAQYCDTNEFHGTYIVIGADNTIGVVWNDSATPGSDVAVYNNNFFGLAIDAFGSISGCSGLFFNVTKQNQVFGFYHSPETFPGTLVNDNSGRADSYIVYNNQYSGSINLIEELTKGIRRGSVQARDNSGTTYGAGPTDLTFNTESYDVSGSFSSPTFTAPYTAKYNVTLLLTHTAGVTATNQWLISCITTARSYVFVYYVPAAALASVSYALNVDMAATDTLKWTVTRLVGAGAFILHNDTSLNVLTVEQVK